jgi:hypothetical protein
MWETARNLFLDLNQRIKSNRAKQKHTQYVDISDCKLNSKLKVKMIVTSYRIYFSRNEPTTKNFFKISIYLIQFNI